MYVDKYIHGGNLFPEMPEASRRGNILLLLCITFTCAVSQIYLKLYQRDSVGATLEQGVKAKWYGWKRENEKSGPVSAVLLTYSRNIFQRLHIRTVYYAHAHMVTKFVWVKGVRT